MRADDSDINCNIKFIKHRHDIDLKHGNKQRHNFSYVLRNHICIFKCDDVSILVCNNNAK